MYGCQNYNINSFLLIGLRISQIRKTKNLTQAELAEKINLSPTEISNIERGKNGISFNTLVKLCTLFDICPCQLLTGAIKESVEENIIDIIREMDKNEREILYHLLLTYIDKK